MVTTVSSKGQAVIPKQVRKALGIEAGSRIEFILDGAGARIVPVRKRKPTSISGGYGMLKYNGPSRSLEDVDVALLLRSRANKLGLKPTCFTPYEQIPG